MFNHAPDDYVCSFCLFAAGVENDAVVSVQADKVYGDDTVTAFIGAKQWPTTPGHVLVIPNAHHENLYDLPQQTGAHIHAVTRQIAFAMKAVYGCAGVSTRQHNEPAGDQDVWHYHVHVFPRFAGDALYALWGEWMSPNERSVYAARLRAYFER